MTSPPASTCETAVDIDAVSHRYRGLTALDGLSLKIDGGQIFGLLGPNGSGKSTLFRLIATLVPIQHGCIEVFSVDVGRDPHRVRESIGVVFQSPSLDRKLTVRENLECQAALYGISGTLRAERVAELSARLGVADRMNDRCEKLSGGLKRRVELAKGLIHRPRLLILDEPSTGLDPTARLELWNALVDLRDHWNTTVLLTTHLLEEADKCDALAILDRGKLVACDTPDRLRRETGETVLSIVAADPEGMAATLRERFGWQPLIVDQTVRVLQRDSQVPIAQVLEAVQASAINITLGRPSLEDVFIRKTGNSFQNR